MRKTFSESAWEKISQIPRGKVSTYSEIARALGKPKAFRAVGNACNANPDAPRVPCHRVVSNGGKLGGYAHGAERKTALLAAEGIEVRGGKIEGFENKFFHLAKKAR